MRNFIAFLAVVATLFCSSTTAFAATDEEVLLSYVNGARKEAGLSALSMDDELTRAAMVRATECAASFSHTRPDGSEFATVSRKANGENLSQANSYNSLEEVFNAWMASPSHKANILYDTSTITGFGIYKSGDVYYIAEEFD